MTEEEITELNFIHKTLGIYAAVLFYDAVTGASIEFLKKLSDLNDK